MVGRRLSMLTALLMVMPTVAEARAFRFGELDGIFDVTLAYGLLVRGQDRDARLIGIANGGSAAAVNGDDGNLNYSTGIASNMVKGTGELTLLWGSLGFYGRGFAFYDFEQELDDRERTQLGHSALELVGKGVEAREYYLSGQFELADIPFQLRIGDQILGWGETGFLRLGVDVTDPINAVAATQPATGFRDLFVPQGMVWGVAHLHALLAVEAFYQYDWDPAVAPPIGTYLSTSDAFGGGRTGFLVLGGGQFSDLGTDLDEAFELAPGTLGFDASFLRVPGLGIQEPSDQGQFGVALQTFLPDFNALKLGLHFVNYHSRLPLVSGRTASAEAVARSSEEAVAAGAEELAALYEAQGLDPAEAAETASVTASLLALSDLAGESGYFVSYPENIQMLGLTFNTATQRTGTLVAGELSHHLDFPFQIDVTDVLNATLSPAGFDDSFGDGPLGSFGAGEEVRGYIRRGKTQGALNLTQLFGPQLGASQLLVSADVGWIHVHDMPHQDELALAAPLTATRNSMGYRFIAQLNYNSLIGGISAAPRVIFTHDPLGVTPGPFSAFVEDRMSLGGGVAMRYLNAWTLDLSYSSFFGAGPANALRDRDFFRLNLTHYL